uniref:Uncharacterized protein n=1 Tax=Rhizophora mucronata TaxID=61149 RepID=A0A2P2Q5Y4_RHIMU
MLFLVGMDSRTTVMGFLFSDLGRLAKPNSMWSSMKVLFWLLLLLLLFFLFVFLHLFLSRLNVIAVGSSCTRQQLP